MATRHPPHISDSTGLSGLTETPPRISLASPLLASEITFPTNAVITYWVYKPLNTSEPLWSLEGARRKLVHDNESYPVTEALLSSVQVAGESASSALYVFAIGGTDGTSPASLPRSAAHLDGLACEL